MKNWLRIGKLNSAVLVLLLIILWELAVRIYELPAWLLPAPSQVIVTLVQQLPQLGPHLAMTITEAAIGFAVAIIFGLVLAFLLDYLPGVRAAIEPVLVASQTIPVITIAPLIIIWLGYGIAPKVAVVILVCFFPVVISLLQGMSSVDPDLINLFRTMGAGRIQIFRQVKLPGALPAMFSGTKIAATYCLMAAIIGEWLGANQGLGYYMLLAQKSFQTSRVFAVILLITLISLGFYQLLSWLERKIVPWNMVQEGEAI